jgi:LEA14-like dessication related protein
VVVTNIYNKMRSDSLALGTLIDANAAEIGNLKIADASLSQRIVADSNNLVNFKAKMKTDSTTLRNLIDANATEIGNLKTADASLSQRIVADSNKLVALQNRVNTFNTNVCDSVDACVKKIVSDTASALRGLIKATDDKFGNYYTISETDNLLGAKADTGWVYTRTVIDNKLGTKANASDVYTKEQTYSKDEVNTLLAAMKARIDSLANVTKNLPKMAQDSFTVATEGQTSFTLKNVPDADHVLRMYINGVMVGGSHSGVLTIPSNSTNTKEVVYNPEKNKNRDGHAYALKAGDKVTVVYWYVKPATAITPGH